MARAELFFVMLGRFAIVMLAIRVYTRCVEEKLMHFRSRTHERTEYNLSEILGESNTRAWRLEKVMAASPTFF